eukprot:11858445-Prorocentrum_lima.AAC.1
MKSNSEFTDPDDLNILDFNKLTEERGADIKRQHAKHNAMFDELQIPGPRIPDDYETLGHTYGVVGDVAVTQGPTDRKVIGQIGKSVGEGFIVREVAAEMVKVPVVEEPPPAAGLPHEEEEVG